MITKVKVCVVMEDRQNMSTKNYAARVVVLVFLILLLFAGSVFFVFFPSYEQCLINAKYNLIREMVTAQISLIAHYDHLVQNGEMSLEEAKQTVIDTMRDIRFGPDQKDYFWINDFRPALIMHPYRPDLEIDDLAEFYDADGRSLLQEFVKIVQEQGQGFHEYPWQWNDDETRIAPKLSFIKGYQPWGWIVGSGIYLDDVHAKIASAERNLFIFFLVTFLCAVITSWIIIRQSLHQDKMRKLALDALTESEQRLT
ncbi:cache domain-containing protein, partial [bacterium]|nr:cache domain-containing protein [bacterium]